MGLHLHQPQGVPGGGFAVGHDRGDRFAVVAHPAARERRRCPV